MSEVHLSVTNPVSGDSSLLDLYPNESITQNWRFTDIAKLDVRGAFTREFRIPASENNVALIGPLFDVNFSGDFSFHKKATAILSVDTVPIDKGYIQIKRVIIRQEVIADFEIVFYAEMPDLVRAIGTLKLSDIDYTDLNHEMTHDNVVDGDPSGRWKYGLTDRGYKFSENGEAGTVQVLNIAQNNVTPNRMTACINAKWLFQTILTNAGFVYDGTELNTLLEGYWIPFVNSKYNQTGTPPSAFFFNLGKTSDEASVSGLIPITGVEFFDNGGNVASSIFTAPFSGYFTFKVWLTIDPPSGLTGYHYALLRDPVNNTTLWSSPAIGNGTNGFPTNHQYTAGLYLNAGDEVQMFANTFSTVVTLKSSATNDPAVGTGWAMVGTEMAIANADISFAANSPDATQVDFVKSILAMHNCILIPDRNIPNKLIIEPMISYLEAGANDDWTAKLDLSKDIVIAPTTNEQKKKLNVTYSPGADVLSKVYQNAGRVYGDYVVEGYTSGATGTANDFTTDELSVKLVFQSTPSNYINGTNIVVPKFMSESGEFVAPGLRILFVAGTASIALFDDDVDAAVMSTVNLLNNYSTVNAEVDDFDLNFAPEVPLHEIVGNPYGNLFNLYYRQYLNEIYSDRARIMEAYFNLSLVDVVTFRFKTRYWIKDSWWRIIDIIDYKVGGDDVTKVKLIKILELGMADCVGRPYTVGIDGVVNFVDENDNPVDATEGCCNRYGYTWNSATSECMAIVGAGTGKPPVNTGFGNQNEFSLALTSAGDAQPDNTQSLLAGFGIEVEEGNYMMTAVGDTLKLLGSNRGAELRGKNVLANMPGQHLGGGWFGNDRSTTDGRAQHGVVVMMGEGDWPLTTTSIELLIDGVAGKRINLIDETMLSCELQVSVVQKVAGLISSRGVAVFLFDMVKYSGTARASTVHTLYDSASLGSFGLAVDVATDTNEHRLSITSTALIGYPRNNIFLSASLRYTQVR